jgi:hypothetical protein
VAVEPGVYDVEFVKAGFQTTKVTRVEVTTTQEVVVNQTLSVASVATRIEVQEAPLAVELEKATPAVGRTLDSQLVQMLPITGITRDATRLALLAPMAVRATGSSEICLNGQRAR